MSKIIENFWDLSEGQFSRKIDNQLDFQNAIIISDELKDFIYWHTSIQPSGYGDYKIENKTFRNCSFAFTKFKNINFQNCKFINCKFNHSAFIKCKFHDCHFRYVNMFKVSVKKTYIEPTSFEKIIPTIVDFSGALKNANMCVAFFQELLDNSKEEGQPDHIKQAEYHFKKWKGLNVIQKKFFPVNSARTTSNRLFLRKIVPNALLYLLTGYGYKPFNFFITFLIGFSFFFYKNFSNWLDYKLVQKDLALDVFCSNEPNFPSVFYYTLDSTTKLVDSQFQATSNYGMIWLTIQSLFGFFLLGALVTIIINKFVR